MTDFNFKEGDKVYCPMTTNKILQVSSDLKTRYCNIHGDWVNVNVYHGGKWNDIHHNPAFFPATEEWYEKLVQIYPNLEKPPKRKEPREVIDAMLNAGHKYVLCEVCCSKDGQDSHKVDAIVGFYRAFFGGSGRLWDDATPITSKGQKIIDFIDGKCVLENGEVVLESEDE